MDAIITPPWQLKFLQSDEAQYKLPTYSSQLDEKQRQIRRACYRPKDQQTVTWCGKSLLEMAKMRCPEGDCVCLGRTQPEDANYPGGVLSAYRSALEGQCPSLKDDSKKENMYNGMNLTRFILIFLLGAGIYYIARRGS